MNLALQIFHKLRTALPRSYRIAGHVIDLPAGHRLDWYRIRFSRYGEPIREVSEVLAAKYPAFTAIDIGANIGDTAALIVGSNDVPVLCVEGNEKFLPFLLRNLSRISQRAEIAASYVGAGAVVGRVRVEAGTARIEVKEGESPVRTQTLPDIVEEHPRFGNSRLLKIDTDGFDSKIILSSLDFIATLKPVIFVEFSPGFNEQEGRECQEMLEALRSVGYCRFHVFDNFGNHMLCLRDDELHQMRSLSAYVKSTLRDLRPALFYYDICATTADDIDLSDALRRRYDGDRAP
ncbi:MAG: FkbM family methyltransferase [Caulobacteraceae bacterium]|nr:FkbM family methyltransferase [Caulobacteraceae bacterium]